MPLQLEYQYLQKTIPRVCTLIDPIEEALREKYFPTLFGGEEINAKFWKILDHSVKHGVLCIQCPRLSVESAYNTSKADSGEPVDSLLGASALNYVGHRACVRREVARKESKRLELAELASAQEGNRLPRAKNNGA